MKYVTKSEMTYNMSIIIWFIGVLFYAFQFISRSSLASFAGVIMHDMSINAYTFSMISSSYYTSYTFSQILIGFFLDRFGHRYIFSICILLCISGCLIFGMSDTVFLSWLGRFLIGLGGSSSFIGCVTLCGKLFSDRDKPVFVGMIAAIGKAGGILAGGPMVDIACRYCISWREIYFYMSVIGLILLIITFLFMKDFRNFSIKSSDSGNSEQKDGNTQSTKRNFLTSDILSHIKLMVKNKYMWIISIYAGFTYVPMIILTDVWVMVFIKNRFCDVVDSFINPDYAGSMMFFGSIVGAPFIPILSRYFTRKMVFFITNFLSFIAVSILLYFNVGFNVAIVLLFLIGLLYGSHTMVFLYGSELFQKIASSAAGFLNTLNMMIGGILLQRLSGFLMDFYGYSPNILGNDNILGLTIGLSVVPASMLIGSIMVFALPGNILKK